MHLAKRFGYTIDLIRADWNLLPVAPLAAVSEPPQILAAHPPDGRLFTDLMFSNDAQIPLRYEGPGPLSFWNGVEILEPYLATLWGYSYALNHDYDLMLTEPARLALEAFTEDWKTPPLARRFTGAWGVHTLALHRPIQEVLVEIGEQEGYHLILDAADGNILYADPSLDLTQRVLDLLNLDQGTTPANTN